MGRSPRKTAQEEPEARKGKEVKGPDDPASVGWTVPQRVRLVEPGGQFKLEAGGTLAPIDVEYETYGRLSPARDNAILIVHALSGDAHVAGWDREAEALGRRWRTRKPGWWDEMVGPGLPLDTERYFIVCSNVLGSCYGTTGPSDIDPATGKPYGLRFPLVTVSDWVRVQALLLDYLGLERVYAVIGGSLGGQQALEWALAFPERVENALVLAASARLSPQGLAFNAVARHTILADPNFNDGDYYGGPSPDAGLSAARMLGHITYLSDESMYQKFGRRLQNKETPDFNFGIEFEVESYLAYQGRSFVERFDANSYLYITRAMDYYDAARRWGGGDLSAACRRILSRVMIVSFSSDWLYPPRECRELALEVCRNGRPVTYVMVPSSYGHDSFLVEAEKVGRLVHNFLSVRAD
jgi:homoserine O-acetyltransferase/O-succinyltransferase